MSSQNIVCFRVLSRARILPPCYWGFFFFYTINAWFIKVRLGWSSAGVQQDTAQRSQNKMVKALPHISISCTADQDGSCDPFTAGPEFLQGGTSGVCDISWGMLLRPYVPACALVLQPTHSFSFVHLTDDYIYYGILLNAVSGFLFLFSWPIQESSS